MLFFYVNAPPWESAPNTAYLVPDNWNDWWAWQTMFTLIVFDETGARHPLGSVKIGCTGLVAGTQQNLTRTPLFANFEVLPDNYFSIGQSDDFYETLSRLSTETSQRILYGLRDLVVTPDLVGRFEGEPVLRNSILRDISDERIRRFFRALHGNAQLTRFNFYFSLPRPAGIVTPTLAFDVRPESSPPTNIHVLIGRNGVGKTRCLQQMSLALLSNNSVAEVGAFQTFDPTAEGPLADLARTLGRDPQSLFNNLVSVTFSAFDPFEPLNENDPAQPLALPYAYVGLKSSPVSLSQAIDILRNPMAQTQATPTKSLMELTTDFVRSVHQCQVGPKRSRWRHALRLLESDPLFREYAVTDLAAVHEPSELSAKASFLYRHMSSGHKIVLLTLSRLIETVEEKTLVLIDEPEAHLHPPLLSAFVRSLSDLLIQRNGVAIIATHSPVVLQESPRSCVWILRRSGHVVKADRPQTETFGENVGILTREVFALEVNDSGFYALLNQIVASGASYEGVLEQFGNQLGAEARAIARALIAARDTNRG